MQRLYGGTNTPAGAGVGVPAAAEASSLESLLTGTFVEDSTVLAAVWRAQSFQNAAAFTLTKVRLYLKEANEAADCDAYMRIETNAAGVPSGSLANANAECTVLDAGLTDTYAWVDFVFATPFSLSASTTYWIVLKNTGDDAASYAIHWQLVQPAYANGQLAQYTGSWATAAYDLLFDVWGTEP